MESTDSAQAGPSNSNTRQKRVLPTRSRRGGPGVGSCDVDLMILETHRRKFENEPLIPADTQLLLTTNSASFPGPSTSQDLGLNTLANYRYFDRPEVLKAYREQLVIETPEFTNVADSPSVGGRFRLRVSEDHIADTSDAAYEKRHRKYETFEKRQRLREKEKLKHEQYKLKERIDQLRAMDSSAFLSLPASAFSPHLGAAEDSSGSSGTQLNGAAAHSEGERRRKEMLEVALMLEERYRILLPPDRLKKPPNQPAVAHSMASENSRFEKERNGARSEVEEEESGVKEPVKEMMTKEVEKLKLKIRFPPRIGHRPPSRSPIKESPRKARGLQATPPLSPPTTRRTRSSVSTAQAGPPSPGLQQDTPSVISMVVPEEPQSARATRSPSIVNDKASSHGDTEVPDAGETPAAPGDETITRPLKRHKPASPEPPSLPLLTHREPSAPPNEQISTPTDVAHPPDGQLTVESRMPAPPTQASNQPTGLLLLAAIRSNKARQTVIRHTTAFGTKVPPEIAEPREFELPDWVLGATNVDLANSQANVASVPPPL